MAKKPISAYRQAIKDMKADPDTNGAILRHEKEVLQLKNIPKKVILVGTLKDLAS